MNDRNTINTIKHYFILITVLIVVMQIPNFYLMRDKNIYKERYKNKIAKNTIGRICTDTKTMIKLSRMCYLEEKHRKNCIRASINTNLGVYCDPADANGYFWLCKADLTGDYTDFWQEYNRLTQQKGE